MADGSEELKAAAKSIDPESLEKAKAAIDAGCREYLHWSALFSKRLETIVPSEMHKFARALALTMLGHLPTHPETCPFCIQYGKDRHCRGCGYALTHGRCDCDDSSFSLFIEAFQELGRAIYQDTGENLSMPREMKVMMYAWLENSAKITREIKEDIVNASCLQLMECKAHYLDEMICTIPLVFFSAEVWEKCRSVRIALNDYW
jgi:uncharacterized protein (DUF983 family)